MNTTQIFRTIAESTYDWEMWVDEVGDLRWVNGAVERFLPISVDECLAMSDVLVHFAVDEDRPKVRAVLERAARGEKGNDLEFRIVGRSGEPEWVSISFQPLIDPTGRFRGYRTSIRDIALRKEHERMTEAAERDAVHRAEERTELLAALSHELRTPLHCISGFVELLLDEETDARRRRYLSLVADQSSSAMRLVEDLLQFAAGPLREPTLRASVVDVDALVESQLDALRGRAGEGVRLRFGSRLGRRRHRQVDVDRLRQIVANLVSNALRFTDSGEVVVGLSEFGDEERVVLEVVDSGVGMDADVLAHARDAFFQGATGPTSSRGGVGLGLAIVERLAVALGGELVIESTVGSGTTARVTMRLPVASPSIVPAEVGEFDDTVGVSALDVLVVDDVDASRELVVAMLASVGVTAREARSGLEAISVCARSLPELILLDYHMPGLDGVATARAIVDGISGDVPRPTIAILTANVLAQSESEAIDRWLTKPLRRGELVRLLRSVGSHASTPDPELDHEILDELDAPLPGASSSLLASKGGALLVALEEAAENTIAATDDRSRRSAAHAARGLAAMLGARGLERRAAQLEAAPGDARASRAFAELCAPTFRSLAARIARSATPIRSA